MASRKPNAAALLAARMVKRLAAQRPTQPDHPFPLLADLIAQEEQPPENETLGKAIGHKDFKNQAIGGDLQDLQSPVAFKDDLAVFASSPQLLVFLQSKTPRGEGQPFLVKDLQKAIRGNAPSLNAELKKAFEAALRPKIEAGELPDVALKKPKPPKPKKPSKAQQLAELSQALLEALKAQRESGGNSYPTTLGHLVQDVAKSSESDESLIISVATKVPFKDQVVFVNSKDDQAPLVLKEDLSTFAGSSQLLAYLQSKTARSEGEPFLVSNLQKAIQGNATTVNAELKKAFEAALRSKIEAGELPDVALKKPKPPKQPKPKKPSKAQQLAELSQALLEALQAQRTSGGDAYPATLRQLAQRAATELSRDEKLVIEAAGKSPFKEQVVAAWSKDLEAPVAFQEDLERLFGAPQLLERALRMKKEKSKTSLAHKANDLAKLLVGGRGKEKEQAAFCSAVARRLTSDSMPPGIGAIRLGPKGEPHFFLLEDLQPPSLRAVLSGAAPVAPHESTAPVASQESAAHFEEFAKRFEELFSQLDRQRGGHNFVSLADLRRELNTVPRAQFDAHLRRLRQERRFERSGTQSEQGLPEELREAGVIEAGNLLMYVSRRK